MKDYTGRVLKTGYEWDDDEEHLLLCQEDIDAGIISANGIDNFLEICLPGDTLLIEGDHPKD